MSGRPQPSMLKAALWYAGLGWRVFPLIAGSSRPAIKQWPERATTDPAQLEQWWGRWPRQNIAVATGPESGLFVIDIDAHSAEFEGEATMIELFDRLGPLPPTATQRSPGGGRHLFFRYPSGRELRNSCGSELQWNRRTKCKDRPRPGVDGRGMLGACTLAPSVRDGGRSYEWLVWPHEVPPADLPEPWIAELESRLAPVALAPIEPRFGSAGQQFALIDRQVRRVADAKRGERNAALFKAAFCLAVRAIEGRVDQAEAEQALLQAALHAGLSQTEAMQTIASAKRSSQRASAS